jgi:hypothetical protein
MRIESWNPNAGGAEFSKVSVDRLVKAAKVIRAATKRRLTQEIGKGWSKKHPVQTRINRPIYKSGPYAGAAWTARQFGQSLDSIRVVQQKTPVTKKISKRKNVRIYAGHYLAFYADIFEFYRPFMRPAFEESIPMVKTLIGAK